MNDFDGLLTSNYGFKPQGKAAPMAASKSTTSSSTRSTLPSYSNFIPDDDSIFNPKSAPSQGGGFDDGVFGGPPKYSTMPDSSSSRRKGSAAEFDFDNMFSDVKAPVYDKPVYDNVGDGDDVFGGGGAKSSSNFENLFASMGSVENGSGGGGGVSGSSFDDFLGGHGLKSRSFRKEVEDGGSGRRGAGNFDDLIPGFGGSSPPASVRL